MDDKLVSVIIPAFKADKYIGQTLASVGAQVYKNWEVIVVEDGFRDKTEEIVSQFKNSFPNNSVIFLRHEVNQGLPGTRNTAIKAASGAYIALLDADDIWEPEHLQIAVDTLTREKADLVYSSAYIFKDNPQIRDGIAGPTPEELKNFPDSLLIRIGSFIQPSTVVMRRQAIESVGLFNAEVRIAEDYDLFIRMADANLKFVYVNAKTCLWRRGHTSLSSNLIKLQEATANVMLKHRSTQCFSEGLWREKTLLACLYIAKYHSRKKPYKTAEFLFKAWTVMPLTKFKYLGGVALMLILALLNAPKTLIQKHNF
ncbi:glycosyltransferase family 2 protein [Leptolyngbya ohadii]|uniref:glycosyltransferase family 2 protein n=1 Tax=Leptolyngbya ohadii TaxID=1962290 RepID=UPI000B59ADA2|nr:glycosyltransferase family 2 protein [Leptolyngbya ohadii]